MKTQRGISNKALSKCRVSHVTDADREILRRLDLGDACAEELRPDRSSFDVQMAIARQIMDDNWEALRALAEYDAGVERPASALSTDPETPFAAPARSAVRLPPKSLI